MLFVFSLYDSGAECYMAPFAVPNKGQALREFVDACNNPETMLFKYPEHFTLFHLGDFDDDKGKFNLFNVPVSLGLAVEYKKVSVKKEISDVN